jgi:glycosyltransferase involved in cell wall biosynthesis
MPRILRIINRFNLGGPTYNAAYLSRYMAPEFETLLVGGEKDDSEENSEFIVRNLGLKPMIISEMKRAISPKNDYLAYQKIKNLIKKYKPDIVHTHASKAGALGRYAAINQKVPVIIHTFHGHVFDAYFSSMQASFYKSIERKLARKSSKIIAISEKQKTDLTKTYKICKEEKIAVIPLGFDLSRFRENMDIKRKEFRQKYNIDHDEIAIGIIGRIVPVKNHGMFLNAIHLLKQKTRCKIRAFIIGDGEDRGKIESKASELNIDFVTGEDHSGKATLTFTSWIKEADRVNAGMDIIALTSLNEGTPVSLIEAQASGKPIVSTAVGGIEDVVIKNKTALLSDPKNIEDFTANLLKLVENENYRNELCLEGWNFVKNKYHYTRLVNDMQQLYQSLLS